MQDLKSEKAVLCCEPVVWNDSNIRLTPVLINSEPYFVAVEVCKLLDLSNPTDRLKSLDDDEKLIYPIDRAGQQRLVNLVNESGFYHLIFLSRKPQAAAIRKWVTSDVLPALRRTGLYELSSGATASTGVGSLRYPRRGESITADILHLLWLIGESLHQGDQLSIALELGVPPSGRLACAERSSEKQQNPDGTLQACPDESRSRPALSFPARDGAAASRRAVDASRSAASASGSSGRSRTDARQPECPQRERRAAVMGRNKIRKRYMVTEGDLFRLYAEIRQVRHDERRDAFMTDFRRLLREAQEVELKIKKGGSDGTL
ncbi:MAG TPA: hypothetical protein DCW71_00730 [Alistipes sp.]|nr:hypothetical protein [Alistipes sp.]